MDVSQVLNHINENTYDDDITVTDIAKGHFLAVTGNTIEEGSTTRNIRVDIFPLEQEERSTQTTNSGLFVRQERETAVKTTVFEDGKELAANTQNYAN